MIFDGGDGGFVEGLFGFAVERAEDAVLADGGDEADVTAADVGWEERADLR
ncbi:MAG: hypothetical protein NTV52_06650 [Acidobacteria bacterium]|nr:hypothetical protein [Acidobacteriota bacterium]